LSQLRCQIAQGILRRHPWQRFLANVYTLTSEANADAFTRPGRGIHAIRRGLVLKLARRAQQALATLHLLDDLECDRKIAVCYGAPIAAEWLKSCMRLEMSLPLFLQRFANAPLQRGLRVPIADTFATFDLGTLQHQLATGNGPGKTPYQIRLEALEQMTAAGAMVDFRPAVSVIPRLDEWEERVLRVEGGMHAGVALRLVGLDEYAREVALPAVMDEVARNHELLTGATIEDLPALASRSADLAKQYKGPQGVLLDLARRQAAIHQLLVCFLFQGLVERGWIMECDGLGTLGVRRRDGHQLDLGAIVRQLLDGSLTREEYRQQIAERFGRTTFGETKPI
jgi:hypothetical protein